MPVLTPAALRKQIRAGTLDAVYLLVGGDEAEKTALVAAMAGLVEEDVRAFNVERFYGGEPAAAAASIVDAARTLPLAAPTRLVIVLQAEQVLAPKRETTAVERDQAILAAYVNAPAAHACVVFVAGRLDERRTLPRLLLKTASVVRCDGLADPAEAARWLREAAGARGLTIEPKAVQLLVGRAAGDGPRVRADAERLFLYAAGHERVTVGDVEAITHAIHTASGDWAVANAIERGAGAEALRELAAQLDGGASPHMVLGQLAWCVRTKLDPRRVPRAIDAVFRTDQALKSSGGDPRVLLERLVVELCG